MLACLTLLCFMPVSVSYGAPDTEPATDEQEGFPFGFRMTQDPDATGSADITFLEDRQGRKVALLPRYVEIIDVDADGNMTRISAEYIMIWLARETTDGEETENDLEAEAVYAEGNVFLERGGSIMRGDRMYINMATHKAIVFNGWAKLVQETSQIPLYIRGAEIKQKAEGKYEIENGRVTTCPYGHPHFAFRAGRLVVEAERSSQNSTGTVQNATVVGKRTFLLLGDQPVFFLPHFQAGLREQYLIESIQYGSSSQLGTFFMTKWDLQQLGILDNEWSRLLLRTDYYSKRGFGYGADFKYSAGGVGGDVEGYLIRDEGKDRIGRVRLEPETNNRGRFKWRHHQWVSQELFAILEVSRSSDPGFLNEFYERELKEDKDQENLLYLRKIEDNVVSTFTGKLRGDDFVTRTEYLPSIGVSVLHSPIPQTGAFYSLDAELSHARRRFDERLGVDGYRTTRLDVNNAFSHPLHAGPVVVRPYVGLRGTAFDDSVVQGGVLRFVGTAGARISTQLHKDYDLVCEWMGLNGVRHIFRPDIRIDSVFEDTQRSRDLLTLDSTEDVDRFDVVRFGFRNILQTVRIPEEDPVEAAVARAKTRMRQSEEEEEESRPSTVDFLIIDLEFSYYPDKDRDNPQGPRFRKFVLTNPGGMGKGRDLSNINLFLSWLFSKEVSISEQMEYNSDSGDLDESTFSIAYRADETTRLSFSHSLIRNNGTSDFASFQRIFPFNSSLETPVTSTGTIVDEDLRSVVTVSGTVALNPKWEVAFGLQHDIENSENERQGVVLRRWLHEWALDISFNRDSAEKNTEVSVSLTTGRVAGDGVSQPKDL